MPTLIERFQHMLTPAEALTEVAIMDSSARFKGFGDEVYNPSELISRKGYRIIDEMRKEEQIKAALLFKKHAVISSGWEVVSPDDQDDDWEVTEFVRDNFLHVRGTLDHALLEIMTAIDYGFSVTEKVFVLEESRIHLAALKTRRPHTFTFGQSDFGEITALYQSQGFKKVPLNPAKFVIFTYMEEFDNPYGTSDLVAAYRAYWSKNNTYKWLLMYLERMGIPPILGLYNSASFTGKVLDSLKTIMKKIQAATVGIVPRGENKDDLEFWSPDTMNARVGEAFEPALDKFDKDMAKAILMPGLLGISPEEAVGSQARARVIFDVFMFVVNQLRQEIEEQAVNEAILKPLVDLNFNVTSYPRFRLLPLSDDDIHSMFKLWVELVKEGVVATTDEDERHIRAATGFPERVFEEEDEEDLPFQKLTFALNRAPNQYEAVMNFQQIETGLNQREQELTISVQSILIEARDRMLRDYARKQAPITVNELPGVSKLRKSYRTFLDSTFDFGREQLANEVPVAIEMQVNTQPREALAYLKDKSIELAATQDQEILKRVKQAVLTGIGNGETTGQVQLRIKAAFEPFVGDPTLIKDDKAMAPFRTEMIARTESTAAFNQGRLVQARQFPQAMRGMQYSAIMDGRTSPVCSALDGRVFNLDDPELDSLKPPNHVNCRSVLVPITITQPVEEKDFITPGQAGRAKELKGQGF